MHGFAGSPGSMLMTPFKCEGLRRHEPSTSIAPIVLGVYFKKRWTVIESAGPKPKMMKRNQMRSSLNKITLGDLGNTLQ